MENRKEKRKRRRNEGKKGRIKETKRNERKRKERRKEIRKEASNQRGVTSQKSESHSLSHVYSYEQCGAVHSVVPKLTNFIGQMWLQLYPVLQMLYSFSHSPFIQSILTSYFLQYLLTGRFHHLQ
jgi:hypothetical protein